MSSFLGRLASRVVASVVATPATPSLQPLSASSPFSTGPESRFGFVEEPIEWVAQPRATAEAPTPARVQPPAVPPGDRPAPAASQAATAGELEPVLAEPVAPVAADDSEPADAELAPRDEPPVAKPAEVEVQVMAAQAPPIERVIEVQEVPGPVVPVVQRVTLPAAETREPTAKEPPSTFASTTGIEPEPMVVFVPGEPLGRMGLDPLQPEEILAHPQVAEAVEHDSTVNVHIGRLEVARPASAPMPPPARPKPNLLSLDDYLAERRAAAVGRGGR